MTLNRLLNAGNEINRYHRPGKSNRSADLGGPAEAAGVLYILTIKASK